MPIAAAVPAIVGAVGSVGSALLSRPSKTTQGALGGLSDLLQTEVAGGQKGLQASGPMLRQSTNATGSVGNYLQSLLSGGRTEAMQAAAPEVNTILSQYDTAKKSLSQFAPRGGGTNAQLANLPFQESGAITNLLAGERSQAAQNLTSLGLGEGSVASSLLPRDSGAGSSLLNYGLQNQAQQGAMFGQVGTSLGTLLGSIFSGGTSSGSDWQGFPTIGGLDTFNLG